MPCFKELNPCKTLFLMCDIQEKFGPAIPLFTNLKKNVEKILTVGKALEVPLVVSEQYPKGLGHTIKALDICHAAGVVAKSKFSMHIPEILCLVKESKPKDLVLFGIEAHVCVFQTACDFLNDGYRVHVVADCSASRLNQDRDMGFKFMRQIGCFTPTSEMVIFGLLQNKDHPKFGSLRKVVSKVSEDMQITNFPPKKKRKCGKSGKKKSGKKKSGKKKSGKKKPDPKKCSKKACAPKKK